MSATEGNDRTVVYDGFSGRELFAAPAEFFDTFPRSGPADDHVAYWRTRVDWRSDRGQWIACLRECGAWDDLQEADDPTLQGRVLWTEGLSTIEERGRS